MPRSNLILISFSICPRPRPTSSELELASFRTTQNITPTFRKNHGSTSSICKKNWKKSIFLDTLKRFRLIWRKSWHRQLRALNVIVSVVNTPHCSLLWLTPTPIKDRRCCARRTRRSFDVYANMHWTCYAVLCPFTQLPRRNFKNTHPYCDV